VRSLLSRPHATAIAIVLLALGIGANTTLFALADAVMFRPFPFADQDRLVIAGGLQAGQRDEVSYPDFVDWRTRARTFDDMAAMGSSNWTRPQQRDEPEPLVYRAVSGNFFDVLGARAAFGRTLAATDDARGAPLAIVLSHRFWRRQFDGDPRAVGRTLVLSGQPYTIVGVMPPGFSYPERPDAWIAIVPDVGRFPIPGAPDFTENRNVNVLFVVGRLKSNVSVEMARADVERIARESAVTYGRSTQARVAISPLVADAVGSARTTLWALLAAVVLLVAAAAANVAGLVLVQMSTRRRELAVRMALGASTGTIARALLCEAALLSSAGAVAALVASRAALPLLVTILPQDLPRIEDAVIDLRAVAFTGAVCAFVVAVCGLLPLATLRASTLEPLMRAGGRTATSTRQNRRSRHLVVAVEIAIAVVILTGASLLYRSVQRLTRLDVGFHADRLLAIEVNPPPSLQAGDRSAVHRFYTRVIDAIRTVPTVESVAGVGVRPLKGRIGLDSSWQAEGQSVAAAKRNPYANLEMVTPAYFSTMGVRVVRGRPFTEDDRNGRAPVAIVGETFARRAWPGESAVGKRLRGHQFDEGGTPPWWTVVGVAVDVRYRDLRSATLDVYVPYDQGEFDISDIVIRTRGSAAAAVPAIRARLRSIDADGLNQFAVMNDELAREQTPWRANLMFFAVFAALTVLIALVGLYGLLASVVAEQVRELAVRAALGASSRRIVAEVLAGAGRTALAGALLGVAAAVASARLVQTMLFEVSPFDARTLVVVPASLLLASLAACLVPALRAARADPIEALRAE
jgi:putative ABC transport system permease protein